MSLMENIRYFGGFSQTPDRAAVTLYMRGWCPYFALALHDRFGWEFIHTGDHLACKRPDGLYVDIRGVMTLEQFQDGIYYNEHDVDEPMTRDQVIADIDSLGFKCGYFYEGDLTKAARLVKRLLPDRINESADGITFENVHLGYNYGQHDCILKLKAHGVEKGWVSYCVFDGEPSIKMLEVEDRRKGYATRLMLELQSLFPDREIGLGMQTEEGAALVASLPTTEIVNTEVKLAFDKLEALRARDSELQKRAEAHEPLEMTSPDEWNDIHDEIWTLEDHLRGKKGTMRLFTAY